MAKKPPAAEAAIGKSWGTNPDGSRRASPEASETDGVNAGHLSNGLKKLTHLAKVIAVQTAVMVQISENREFQQEAILSHQANEVGESNSLGQRNSKMKKPIPSIRISTILPTNTADHPPKTTRSKGKPIGHPETLTWRVDSWIDQP
jgi:hypothetical protein